MSVVYQITFYELGAGEMTSAFLESNTPFPALQLGDTLHAKDFAGLEAFSPLLEIVHAGQEYSSLNRGETHHQRLVFTRAYDPRGAASPAEDLGRLDSNQMMGDM
ncbi:MAG: hypothetical protein AVDCRST_MAG56-7366 [uncultured Cytophagales bacterium]|uniref:Uncharacterized protein n=1 Tax=uncultured Cytophagales bacterium TaxID=158755 RepID=A0A6J4LIS1_9SPHI|nr:MAG: hypothetical protein AVDCRST_MAG56-7366 [uncultured Cytophagales bacterium]